MRSPVGETARLEMMPLWSPSEVLVLMILESRPGRDRSQITSLFFRPPINLRLQALGSLAYSGQAHGSNYRNPANYNPG